MNSLAYEVHISQGQGGCLVASFVSHKDATEFVDRKNLEKDGSYYIVNYSDFSA